MSSWPLLITGADVVSLTGQPVQYIITALKMADMSISCVVKSM